MAYSTDRAELRASFEAAFGYWDERWEALLETDPILFAGYLDLATVSADNVPGRTSHLGAKVRALVFLAVDVASTHLYLPGVRQRIVQALDAGASREEIVEVVQLVSGLGIHAMNIGVPLLQELLAERGESAIPESWSPEQERLKADFTRKRGYWHAFWEGLLALDPQFFEAFIEFSSIPWEHGVLEPKVKEFVYTAFDSSSTHLYVEGWKLHMRNALNYGATPQELLEVMEISSTLGIHGPASAAPILLEELRKRGMPVR